MVVDFWCTNSFGVSYPLLSQNLWPLQCNLIVIFRCYVKILGDLLLIHSFYCVMMGSEPYTTRCCKLPVIGWHCSFSYLICKYPMKMKLMQSFLQWLAASGRMEQKSILAKSFIDSAGDLAHIMFVSELFYFNLLMAFKAVYANEFIRSFYEMKSPARSCQMSKFVSYRFRPPSSIAVASTHKWCCPC